MRIVKRWSLQGGNAHVSTFVSIFYERIRWFERKIKINPKKSTRGIGGGNSKDRRELFRYI